MMRSPRYWAVACRAPNGDVVVRTEALEKTWIGRQQWLKKPFLRGMLAMFDTMALGIKAMNIASNIQLDDKYNPEKNPHQLTEEQVKEASSAAKKKKAVDNLTIAVTVVISLGLGFLIFNVMPQALAQFLRGGTVDQGGTGTNYLAEVLKMVVFIGYLAAIAQIPSIKEVFRYHGAEHKAINVIEAKEPLDISHSMGQTRLHPRCGTNFAIIMVIVGFLLFPLIPRYFELGGLAITPQTPAPLVVLSRILIEVPLLFVVSGISYEIIRAAGRMKDQKWVNIMLKPGLATQLITTAEPEEKHIEVAIESLNAVLKAEETGELTNGERQSDFPVVPTSP